MENEKKSKKEVKSNPILLDNTDISLYDPAIINNDIEEYTEYEQEKETDDSDTFFRSIIKELQNSDNISGKTEYRNVIENFDGAKLEFLSDVCQMPYARRFLRALEFKRLSLERKSRKELVMIMERREEDNRQMQQIATNQAKMLGI